MEFDPPVLILLIAATGFLFCNWCNLVRYELLRDSGHRLYLSSIFYGFVFYLAVYMLWGFQKTLWVEIWELTPVFEIKQAELPGYIAIISFVGTIVLTIVINNIKGIRANRLQKAWRKSDFDLLCSEASAEIKPITVTLDNRKVYIGLVHDSLEPGKEANLTIIPLFSGYRDNDTLDLKLTKKYTSLDTLFDQLATEVGDENELVEQINDYRIVIPRERIVTVNIAALYSNFDDPLNEVPAV